MFEREKAYTFDGVSLLLGDVDLVGAWREGALPFLTQKLQELLLVLTNQLGNLRVTRSDLLKDGLQHLGLLLDQLTELLEVGVVTEEIQAGKTFTRTRTRTRSSSSSTGTSTTSSTPFLAAGLSCCLEQVDGFVATPSGASGTSRGRGLGRGSSGGGGLLLLLLLLLLFFLDVLRNALYIVR